MSLKRSVVPALALLLGASCSVSSRASALSWTTRSRGMARLTATGKLLRESLTTFSAVVSTMELKALARMPTITAAQTSTIAMSTVIQMFRVKCEKLTAMLFAAAMNKQCRT